MVAASSAASRSCSQGCTSYQATAHAPGRNQCMAFLELDLQLALRKTAASLQNRDHHPGARALPGKVRAYIPSEDKASAGVARQDDAAPTVTNVFGIFEKMDLIDDVPARRLHGESKMVAPFASPTRLELQRCSYPPSEASGRGQPEDASKTETKKQKAEKLLEFLSGSQTASQPHPTSPSYTSERGLALEKLLHQHWLVQHRAFLQEQQRRQGMMLRRQQQLKHVGCWQKSKVGQGKPLWQRRCFSRPKTLVVQSAT
eukprot:SM000095S24995  [mRNA]  locus=s95:489055:490114:+ [translate_table: standard]